MIREIVQAGHPVLRRPAERVDPAWIGSEEFRTLVQDMVETMRDAPGVGLAAPQIGVSLQLVVLEDRSETLETMDDELVKNRAREIVPLTVLVNPKIKRYGRNNVEF